MRDSRRQSHRAPKREGNTIWQNESTRRMHAYFVDTNTIAYSERPQANPFTHGCTANVRMREMRRRKHFSDMICITLGATSILCADNSVICFLVCFTTLHVRYDDATATNWMPSKRVMHFRLARAAAAVATQDAGASSEKSKHRRIKIETGRQSAIS